MKTLLIKVLCAIYRFADKIDALVVANDPNCTQDVTTYEYYGGPNDGNVGLYEGLVIRLGSHPDGAYCFRGHQYTWIANSPIDKT